MFLSEHALERTLRLYLSTTRGGPTRLRILLLLREHPQNTNQLATALGMDYTTIMYHLRVLAKHGLITMDDKKYDSQISLSPLLQRNAHVIDIGKGFLTSRKER